MKILKKISEGFIGEQKKYLDVTGGFRFDYREESNVGFVQRACVQISNGNVITIQECHDVNRTFMDLEIHAPKDGLDFSKVECKTVWLSDSQFIFGMSEDYETIPLQKMKHDSPERLAGSDWVCFFVIPDISKSIWTKKYSHGKSGQASVKQRFERLIENSAEQFGKETVWAAGSWAPLVRGNKGDRVRFGVAIIFIPKKIYLKTIANAKKPRTIKAA